MPSITYWNRLEVRPRSANFASALSARIRDPLWMLTRQWQFGEFKGEDAAAPAYVEVATTQGHLAGWQQGDGTVIPIREGTLMEPMVEAESLTPDFASRVEVGQLFEQLLTDEGVPELIPDFRNAFPISESEAGDPDHDTFRFRQLAAGRTLDGIALHQAGVPGLPPIDSSKLQQVEEALMKLASWISEVWGTFGTHDATIWKPDRLEYDVTLVAGAPDGSTSLIQARPGSTADFGWQSLDVKAGAPAGPVTIPPVESRTQSVIPGRVQFRGMPNHRWWDFENGQMDFGGLTPDKRDLTKLVVMDFMLVQGNDWFVIPFEQVTGTLTRVDSLLVHDVFGGVTRIERADTDPGPPGQRWSLFSTSSPASSPPGPADYFILPSNVGPAVQQGIVLEEVRFLRDEMANMAWAVEHVAENGIGRPWPGHERDLAIPAPELAPASGTPLRYQLQTRVPQNWLPLIPVAIDPQEGDIALELGALLTQSAEALPILPTGRILQPSSLADGPYRIREEEVPREGLQVSRVMCRCRGSDGSTHLWVARRKRIGRGEGSSGLRFDLAVPEG